MDEEQIKRWSAMRNTDWDKTEIKRLARESGKPMEVRCAEAFIKAK